MQSFGADIPSGLDWDRNYRDYVDAVRRRAGACEEARVGYTIEAHPFAYVANTAAALRLLEHVGSDALAVNFDPSHTFPIGDFPNVSIYQLGSRVRHVHASDNDGVTNVHWRPGRGKIDWKAMFRALHDVGYDGVVSIELEDVPGVSRGPSDDPGVYRNKTATDEFVAETVAGAEYLEGDLPRAGITVDEAGLEGGRPPAISRLVPDAPLQKWRSRRPPSQALLDAFLKICPNDQELFQIWPVARRRPVIPVPSQRTPDIAAGRLSPRNTR